ncbi:MAG: hypothetical protein KGH74_03195 [Candidatus Micrarchaeota archaeon]|nr:hypothetical protein [Candidatus Micrarchaeota archaeon]
MDLLIVIPLIALVYVTATIVVQRKVSNIERMRELQQGMKDRMKELNSMIKSNADKAAIDAKNKELSAIASENMKHTMKASFIILPISLIVFYYLLPLGFGHSTFSLDILSFKLNYQTYFVVVAVIAGLAASVLLGAYDKRRLAKKAAANSEAAIST